MRSGGRRQMRGLAVGTETVGQQIPVTQVAGDVPGHHAGDARVRDQLPIEIEPRDQGRRIHAGEPPGAGVLQVTAREDRPVGCKPRAIQEARRAHRQLSPGRLTFVVRPPQAPHDGLRQRQ